MTPLQKGRFAQYYARKWENIIKNDIKLPSEVHGNTENTLRVGINPTHLLLKTEHLQ